jgi:hypothetical protein
LQISRNVSWIEGQLRILREDAAELSLIYAKKISEEWEILTTLQSKRVCKGNIQQRN